MHAELLVDVGPVTLHGLLGNDQLLRDFLGRHALRQHPQDLLLRRVRGSIMAAWVGGLIG